ncbi:MAG: hypothetical protein ACE5OQ_04765 [Woeseia sp.]
MDKKRPINVVLAEENKLLACLIAEVEDFDPQTEEGMNLRKGWMSDLTEWKQSNQDMMEMTDEELREALKREQHQLGALIGVSNEFGTDSASRWWKDYLERERESAGRLERLV